MKTRVCRACGQIGIGVEPGIRKVDNPQPVRVSVPRSHDWNAGYVEVAVPGLYISGDWCCDKTACHEREEAQGEVGYDNQLEGALVVDAIASPNARSYSRGS